MLPGIPFLPNCQTLSAIRPVSPQWYRTGVHFSFNLIYGNMEKSQGAKSGERGGWG